MRRALHVEAELLMLLLLGTGFLGASGVTTATTYNHTDYGHAGWCFGGSDHFQGNNFATAEVRCAPLWGGGWTFPRSPCCDSRQTRTGCVCFGEHSLLRSCNSNSSNVLSPWDGGGDGDEEMIDLCCFVQSALTPDSRLVHSVTCVL